MKKYPCLKGLSDGHMNLFLRFFSMNLACSCNSACDKGNTLDLITVSASGSSSILWSHGRGGGNRWASWSLNTLLRSNGLNARLERGGVVGFRTTSVACGF